MKLDRTKNTSRNIVYGVALQITKLAVPFFMRTVMLYLLGIRYLGLNSLFTSVLTMLNLAELGVGSAMVYSMYKPIIEDDTRRICALMQLYKIYYRVIGLVVLVLGLCLLPFIPNLIHGEIPENINLYILYLLNLLATVFTYWLFAYKNSLLQAHQRQDMISKATLITDTIKYGLQLGVLVIFRNYYLYVLAILTTQILNNLLTAMFAERMYPRYHAEGNLDKRDRQQINRRVRDLFTAKIGTAVVYQSDTIVISAFLGLTTLAIYQNYYYLFSAVTALVTILFTSVKAGLGNSIILDSREKLFSDFKKFMMIVVWIAGLCSACFLCLYQPFMELWVGEEYLLEFGVVICLVVYFFVHCLNVFLNSYKDASGIWRVDRFRPLVEAMTNLTMNILLVQLIGLYGVILSTIFSMLLVGPWLVRNVFRFVIGTEFIFPFAKRLLYYTGITVLACVLTYRVCVLIVAPLVVTIAVRLGICVLGTNLTFFICYCRMPEFDDCVQLADRVCKGKLKILRRLNKR